MPNIVFTFSLFITGCGCSKNEEIKKMKCVFEDSTTEQYFEEILEFKNNYLVKQNSKLVEKFLTEESAKSYYADMIAYGEILEINGNEVIQTSEFTYDSTHEKYLFDNIKKTYEDAGYKCS